MKLPPILNALPFFAAIALIVMAINGNSENANVNNADANIGNGNLGERIINNILPTDNLNNSIYGTVKPGSVYDGDTIRIINRNNGEEIKIRFCGIDAPEKNQPGGIEARDYLRSLLPDNADVVIVPVERDRYGRLVGEVWNDALTETDQNVNAAMILSGHAWHYKQYSDNCPNREGFATAEQIAGKPSGTPPWEWRKQNK